MKKQKYRVFINQVNQQSVVVEAVDENEAREKGYNKWKKEHAHSYVTAVEKERLP